MKIITACAVLAITFSGTAFAEVNCEKECPTEFDLKEAALNQATKSDINSHHRSHTTEEDIDRAKEFEKYLTPKKCAACYGKSE